MTDTAAPTTAEQLAPPAGYPRTADGWVTFQRVRHTRGAGMLLVQKRDGCTRTVWA
jgi:hypothetical protein